MPFYVYQFNFDHKDINGSSYLNHTDQAGIYDYFTSITHVQLSDTVTEKTSNVGDRMRVFVLAARNLAFIKFDIA